MIEKYTLRNGIPVFVAPSSSSPVVSIQAWVRRGSAHEPDKLAGISHFIEHALFKGTKKRDVGEIALEIEACGGEINAFTSYEETVYYATLASRFFEQGLDVISDAVSNPSFEATEMDREREVILEEIKRAFDSPHKMAYTNLWKNAYAKTPYGRPVLGFESTVSSFSANTLRGYFNRNYHTGSMGVFIVGDVDPKKAFALCQAKLKSVKKGRAGNSMSPLQLSELKTSPVESLGRDIKECYVNFGFRAPAIADKATPSTDLVCSAVGQGESGRFFQRLVKEKKVCLDADMGLVSTNRGGLVTVSLVVTPENIYDAIAETSQLLNETLEEGIDETEISRVKSAAESEVVYAKETVESYARRLGYYHNHFGDPEYEATYLDQMMKVSHDEAEGALRTVLRNKPAFSIVHPRKMKLDKTRVKTAFNVNVRKRVRPITSSKPSCTPIEGIRYVHRRLDNLPVVAIRLLFRGGSREEQPGQYGVGNLLQRTWSSGTQSFSSKEMAHRLESLGASVNTFCGRNTMGISAECLSRHWSQVKPLLTEIIQCPTFPQDELDTEKYLTLKEIASESDSPGSLCQINFAKSLYGDHPLGRSHLGLEKDVERSTREDLMKFREAYLYRENTVVSLVGHMDSHTAQREFEGILGKLPKTGHSIRANSQPDYPTTLTVVTAQKQPLAQSHILVGFPGLTFDDPRRYAVRLLSSALSGQGGRLFLELRDNQSLAYTVAPITSDNIDSGMFGVYIGCSPGKVETALTGIRKELEKVCAKPMPASELQRAKRYWLGRFELDMQRYGSQAMLFGLDEAYGLGFDHAFHVANEVKKITSTDIQKIAQELIRFDRAVISIVHPTELPKERVVAAWS